MGHIDGNNRYQTKIMSIDDYVEKDNIVRFIDRFVEIIDLEELGFANVVPSSLGRNSYDPHCLTKLYVYGYENGIRSSRKLERQAKINVEVMWLMDELAPDFKTIADFRKNNIEAFKALFYEYASFCDSSGLFGKDLFAVDGTKLKASNNKKNNYSKKKIQRNINYHSSKIEEYLTALEESDDMDEATELIEKIKESKERIRRSDEYLKQLEQTGEGELSIVDPDARLMGNNRGGVDMAYNVQASVDAENHLVADFDVIKKPTDHGQLSNMIEKTQETLRKKGGTYLADKGYYGSDDLSECEKLDAGIVVARQKKPGEKDGRRFSADKFTYDRMADEYVCPAGQLLAARSKSETKTRKFFNKDACKNCPHKETCLSGKIKFRVIYRSANNDVLDRADQIYADNAELYKLRQQIVEHVFGTVKRTMNGGYLLLRTKEKVKAEAALLFLGYNIKRTKTILGFDGMMAMLDEYERRISPKYQWQTFSILIRNIICRFRVIHPFLCVYTA